MSDLSNLFGELLISPGEIWDRLTILELKVTIMENRQRRQSPAKEWRLLNELLQRIHDANFVPGDEEEPRWDELIRLVDKLRKQNKVQWDCEDKVRTEKSWEAAQAARDSNSERVYIKNEINRLYDYCIDEKDYAGEGDVQYDKRREAKYGRTTDNPKAKTDTEEVSRR